MDKVVLNNGLEIEGATVARAVWAGKLITVNVPGDDIAGTAVLFGNPENTGKIEHYQTLYKIIYHGYSTAVMISRNRDGTGIEVSLQGDEHAHWEREYLIPSNFIPDVIANSINQEEEKENEENGPGENDSNGQD